METCTKDPSDHGDQDRWVINLLYSCDPPAIATIQIAEVLHSDPNDRDDYMETRLKVLL